MKHPLTMKFFLWQTLTPILGVAMLPFPCILQTVLKMQPDGTGILETELIQVLKNPEYTYAEAGNYVVNLTVSNGNGTDSKTLEIVVDEAPIDDEVPPVADFTPILGAAMLLFPFMFTDSSQNATGWDWDFGDGATSTVQNPMHTLH